jgi:hypothetical protein
MPDGGFSTDGGQVLAPDGTVSYDFQGHISAQGVDLLASTSNLPNVDNRVQWHEGPGGALVAQAFGFSGNGGGGAELAAIITPNTPQGVVSRLRAAQAGGRSPVATIQALADPRGGDGTTGVASVTASALAAAQSDVTIIDSNGASDFAFGSQQARQAFPFLNGWANYNGGFAPCVFYRIGNTLFLEGLASSAAAGANIIGQLPSGWRPSARHIIATGGSDPFSLVRLDIGSDGIVQVVQGPTSYFVTLSGIQISLL